MNWVLSVLAGLALAVLVLYFIKKNQAPVAIETYVQQPVRKGADISEQDSMLVAVGLQALYTPRPSVMDASEISKDAWLASQAAATGGAQSPTSALVQQAAAEQQAPVGAGSGMAGSPMWSAGAMASQTGGGGVGQMQVFLPGGPSAAEQLQGAAPTSSGAAAPRARTAAEIEAEQAEKNAKAFAAADENNALLQESAEAENERNKFAILKAEAVRVYKDEWLPKRPSGSRNDTAANRASYVASLVAKLQQDKMNFDNYFESEWKEDNGEYVGDAAQTAAFMTDRLAKQKSLQDSQKIIDSLDETWQNSNAVDCYRVPWPAFATETACSRSCGPGKKRQFAKYVEPQNGGAACPPPSAREFQDVNCTGGNPPRECARTVSPASSTCAPGYVYRTTDKKCVLTSQVPAAQGCTSDYAYSSTSGYCTRTGYTSTRPTPPTGYVFNTTTKAFEKTSDPTWSCTATGFNLDTGLFGTIYPPECVGYV